MQQENSYLFIAENNLIIRSELVQWASAYDEQVFSYSSLENLIIGLKNYKNIILYLDLDFQDKAQLKEVLKIILNRKDIVYFLASQFTSEYNLLNKKNKPFAHFRKPMYELPFITSLINAKNELSCRSNMLMHLSSKINEYSFSTNDISNEIARAVKSYRLKRHLTQTTLSEYLGISARQIQRIESGNSNITLDNLIVILKGLNEDPKLKVSKETK